MLQQDRPSAFHTGEGFEMDFFAVYLKAVVLLFDGLRQTIFSHLFVPAWCNKAASSPDNILSAF